MSRMGLHPTLIDYPQFIFSNFESKIHLDPKAEKKQGSVVVYTCITNGYDHLLSPLYTKMECDLIVFTDDPNLHIPGWKTVVLSNFLDLDSRRLSRLPKILPHLFLHNYDYSIYVDASLTVMGNLSSLLSYISNNSIAACLHSDGRNCLFQEAEVIESLGWDNSILIQDQMKRYKAQGMPTEFGLYECGLLMRRHNDIKVIKAMEIWWQELINYSHRDQLSFTFALWKSGLEINGIDGNVRSNNLVQRRSHLKSN